jgi:hypothetical protein
MPARSPASPSNFEESRIVAGFMKDGTPTIASIEDVIAVPTLRVACTPWHEPIISVRTSTVKN